MVGESIVTTGVAVIFVSFFFFIYAAFNDIHLTSYERVEQLRTEQYNNCVLGFTPKVDESRWNRKPLTVEEAAKCEEILEKDYAE